MATATHNTMPTRYDLGDYTCRILVYPTDTILGVLQEVSNFLASKGWINFEIESDEAAKTGSVTHRAQNLDGTFKFLKLHVMALGADIVAYVEAANSAEGGLRIGYGNVEENWSGRMFIRLSTVNNNLYMFASPRYAMFLSENSVHGIGSGTHAQDRIDMTVPRIYGNFWTSAQPLNAIGPVESYTGDSLVVPSGYNYFSDTTYASHSNFGCWSGRYTDQMIQQHTYMTDNTGHIQIGCAGASGVVEGNNQNSFVSLFNTAKVIRDEGLPDSTVLRSTLKGSPSIQTLLPARNEKSNSRVIGLFDDVSAYCDRNKANVVSPFNSKKVINPILLRDETKYVGELSSLYLTQPRLTQDFMTEVWLKVDANFRVSTTGELTKFFVIPGSSSVNYKFLERYWTWANANKTRKDNLQKYSYSTRHSDCGLLHYAYATANLSTFGHWTEDNKSGSNLYDSAFLIPA